MDPKALAAKHRPRLSDGRAQYEGPFSDYEEIHAALFGFGYVLLFYIALILWPPLVALATIQMARALYYAYTGRRLDIGGHRLGLPDEYLCQINNEPHYFSSALGVTLIGGGVGLEYAGFDVMERMQNIASFEPQAPED